MEHQQKIKKIAVMGGTFDPIHYGHLVTAEAVRHAFDIEKVLFIPTGRPPHKTDKPVTENKHRYAMTVLATISNPFFFVSDLEIERQGFTYTIDTIVELRRIYGEDTTIYFITGADAINQILTWKNSVQLFSLCEFVAVSRPGYSMQDAFEKISYVQEHYQGVIHVVEVPALAISSTDIRQRVLHHKPIQYLLPDSVATYINKFDIYKSKELLND